MSEQKRIVITGATKGLGKALAEELINRGHIIYGCGRSETQIKELVDKYPDHNFSIVDVANFDEVKLWANKIILDDGIPDILINNAAVMLNRMPLWKIEKEDFYKLINVNINGVYNCIKNFVPKMVENRKGTIINLSSGWGKFTSPEVAPYCTSKFGIEGMSKALAQELPKGMVCVPLSPGIIDTEMLRGIFGDGADRYEKPETWGVKAADLILNLTEIYNGESLEVE